MTNLCTDLPTKAGLTLGRIPRVVGVATQLQTAADLLQQEVLPCDLLELRLDHILLAPEPTWGRVAVAAETRGVPIIATLRLAAEGGAWTAPDEDRWPLLCAACAGCSCVDVELQSPLWQRVVAEARRQDAVVLVSHHNFQHTPSRDELDRIIEQVDVDGPVIIKMATRVNTADDVDRLRDFLDGYRGQHPLCLIGMGVDGVATRVEFPRRGSCLTYGHLDESTAPGQLSCQELARHFREQS